MCKQKIYLYNLLKYVLKFIMNNELNLISEDSEASDIELDTKYVITDHNNKVYCRCY
ncbi:hypothetical protein C2G38_2055273, partial [Gigaspora rosea]